MSMDPATGTGDRPPLPLPHEAPSAAIPSAAPMAPVARLNVAYHVVIGVAAGFVSLITLLAWPFALLTGMVIGKANSERRLGRRQGASALQLLAVTGGVLGMLFFGALIGGLLAFLVVALAAFSERVAENTSPVDQTMARLILCMTAVVAYVVGWFVLGSLGFQLSINFGG